MKINDLEKNLPKKKIKIGSDSKAIKELKRYIAKARSQGRDEVDNFDILKTFFDNDPKESSPTAFAFRTIFLAMHPSFGSDWGKSEFIARVVPKGYVRSGSKDSIEFLILEEEPLKAIFFCILENDISVLKDHYFERGLVNFFTASERPENLRAIGIFHELVKAGVSKEDSMALIQRCLREYKGNSFDSNAPDYLWIFSRLTEYLKAGTLANNKKFRRFIRFKFEFFKQVEGCFEGISASNSAY